MELGVFGQVGTRPPFQLYNSHSFRYLYVLEFWLYHNVTITQIGQFYELSHLQRSDLRSIGYSLSDCEIRAIWGEIHEVVIATPRILVQSRIWMRWMKDCSKLHNLRINQVTIRSQLKLLIAAKPLTVKCRVFDGKPAQLQWSGLSCSRPCCNRWVPDPTLIRNHSSRQVL